MGSTPHSGRPGERVSFFRLKDEERGLKKEPASKIMNEQQSETSFLRHCLHYGEGAEHETLENRIIQVQRDERCVCRALWLTAMLTVLAVAGLGYGVVFVDNFPYNMPHFIVNTAFAVGAGSLISFLAFVVLGMAYR